MIDLSDPVGLAPLPHHPEGKWFVALQDCPKLGIVKGQLAYSWRSSLVYLLTDSSRGLSVLARPVDWDPETFCDWWVSQSPPAW